MSETIQPEKWRDPEVLEATFKPLYRDDLEFHNWSHVLSVRDLAQDNAALCQEHGLEINMDIIEPASFGHDSSFWLVPRGTPGRKADHRFTTKERFSAHDTGVRMRELGMPETKVRHVERVIRSTERGIACTSLEARCVRQADLANVASRNPITFLNSTLRLYREAKHLRGESLPDSARHSEARVRDFIAFAAISHEILSTFNAEDVSLGDFDRDQEGHSLFSQRAAKNISLLVSNRLRDIVSSPRIGL